MVKQKRGVLIHYFFSDNFFLSIGCFFIFRKIKYFGDIIWRRKNTPKHPKSVPFCGQVLYYALIPEGSAKLICLLNYFFVYQLFYYHNTWSVVFLFILHDLSLLVFFFKNLISLRPNQKSSSNLYPCLWFRHKLLMKKFKFNFFFKKKCWT